MDGFKPLGHYLQKLLDERGLREKIEDARVPEYLRQVVGEAIWQRIESVSFSNGELIIRTMYPVWRIELRLRAEILRARVNEIIGREHVHRIMVL
ncbi:MAG: DUF721 domain-containing protein [Bacteroidota bacterium]|nr:DUF721 domain-containing protein [Candidatus Kapabacteria bacterium]MCS7302636.1 DUF721 domain-containing protein [Candidatus Kapabacteria bacterium]MCX7936249.1 DUF721 domain-containing protein [Chlorobiota bacterium]MDW8074470.1 DUF721 domain-containing protein [Bacteroidota bacterium]MDW8271054.1 DUF721 domain-containing protein [Bacteroidota bacterium]